MNSIARGVLVFGVLPVVCVTTGCLITNNSPQQQPQTIPASQGVPVLVVQAAPGAQSALGVAQWEVFMGMDRAVVTGFDGNGNAVSGLDLQAVARSGGALAYVHLTLLDGSDTELFHLADGTNQGTVSAQQALFLAQAVVDLSAYAAQNPPSPGADGCMLTAAAAAPPIEAGAIACTLGQSASFESALASVEQQGGAVAASSIPGCGDMADAMAAMTASCTSFGDAGCVLDPSTGGCSSGDGFGVTVGDSAAPGSDAGAADDAMATHDGAAMAGDAMAAPDAQTGDGGEGDAGHVIGFSGDGGGLAATAAGQTDGIDDMASNQACPSCAPGTQQLVMSGQTGYVETTVVGDYAYGGEGFVIIDGTQDSQDTAPVQDISQDSSGSQDGEQDTQDSQDATQDASSSQDGAGSQDSQDSQDAQDPGTQDDVRSRYARPRSALSRLYTWLAR